MKRRASHDWWPQPQIDFTGLDNFFNACALAGKFAVSVPTPQELAVTLDSNDYDPLTLFEGYSHVDGKPLTEQDLIDAADKIRNQPAMAPSDIFVSARDFGRFAEAFAPPKDFGGFSGIDRTFAPSMSAIALNTASGKELDKLAERHGVPRLNGLLKPEDDDSLRHRLNEKVNFKRQQSKMRNFGVNYGASPATIAATLAAAAASPQPTGRSIHKPTLHQMPRSDKPRDAAKDLNILEELGIIPAGIIPAGIKPITGLGNSAGKATIALDIVKSRSMPPDAAALISSKGAVLLTNIGTPKCRCGHKEHRHTKLPMYGSNTTACGLCGCTAFHAKES